MYIHKEGRIYVILATIIFLILSYFLYRLTQNYPVIGILIWTLSFLLYIWVWWFFRMYDVTYPHDDALIYAPAEGKVVVIEETEETEYFHEKMIQVSIFMSPLNVHVNRNPISGIVKYFRYHKGKYLVAWHPKSSTENERTTMVIENGNKKILVRQIAGAVARRICWYVKEGDEVKQNDEFGFIKFGSRVDVFLPLGTDIVVNINELTKGGETILARWK